MPRLKGEGGGARGCRMYKNRSISKIFFIRFACTLSQKYSEYSPKKPSLSRLERMPLFTVQCNTCTVVCPGPEILHKLLYLF